MTDRNLVCRTCGTKVFKSPGEVDDHHQESHPEVESKPGENHLEVSEGGANQDQEERHPG